MKKLISILTAIILAISLISCGLPAKTDLSTAKDYLDLGQKYLLDGDYEQAIVAFEKVIEIDPKNVDAYLSLAEVYIAQGDYESAIAVLEQGYAENNNDELANRVSELRGIIASSTVTFEVTTTPETTAEPEPEEPIADIVWTLEDGVLTISGEGRMPEYMYPPHYERAPWYEQRDDIRNVYISDGITSIGNAAFSSCTYLTTIEMPNGLECIGNNAFSNNFSLTSIIIPESVERIEGGAFYITGLRSISIPRYVNSIGGNVFTWCSGLLAIDVVDDNEYYCNSSDGVLFTKDTSELICYPCGKEEAHYDIPDGTTVIGECAFSGCNNLVAVTIPSSVTSIGYNAFDAAQRLSDITIPSSVTYINGNVFSRCYSLSFINVDTANMNYCSSTDGVLFTKDMTRLISYPNARERNEYIIPNGVTDIEECAFLSCYNLTKVTIPSSVTSIGSGTFAECNDLIISAPSGSYAEQYANEHGITFVAQ